VRVLAGTLVLLLVALAAGDTTPAAAAPPGFVYRSGTQLMLDGAPYRFTGLNIYNANSDGWCWYQMNAGPELDSAFTEIGPGKDAMRAWFNQPLAIDKSTGLRDWSGFDHTLGVAATHGVRVIVTLSGQWGECGDGGLNGYKGTDWYTSGYTEIDPGMLVSYRDWAAEVVARYKDDPMVLAWQLMNEAEVSDYLGAPCPPGTGPREALRDWAEDVSSLIKSIDPHHLVSLGTIGSGQCGTANEDYQYIHDLPGIDLCEYHDYWDPAPIPGDQWNGLQVRIDQCNALGKPLFVGETGVRPDDVGGALQDRADVLRAKIDAQFAQGIDGVLAWAWSNLGSTYDNFDIGPDDPALEALILDDNCPAVPNPDQENFDADAWGDACDNCPAVPTMWLAPMWDSDCDGFSAPHELDLGTDPDVDCGFTAGGMVPSETWPPDFVPTNTISIQDVLAMKPVFNGTSARHDLVPSSGTVTIQDVLAIKPFFNQACAP
jgi:hypothetical protein